MSYMGLCTMQSHGTCYPVGHSCAFWEAAGFTALAVLSRALLLHSMCSCYQCCALQHLGSRAARHKHLLPSPAGNKQAGPAGSGSTSTSSGGQQQQSGSASGADRNILMGDEDKCNAQTQRLLRGE